MNKYCTMNQRSLIQLCLVELNYDLLAKEVHEASHEKIDNFLSIIKIAARNRNQCDILDRLAFAGLIYSHGGL